MKVQQWTRAASLVASVLPGDVTTIQPGVTVVPDLALGSASPATTATIPATSEMPDLNPTPIFVSSKSGKNSAQKQLFYGDLHDLTDNDVLTVSGENDVCVYDSTQSLDEQTRDLLDFAPWYNIQNSYIDLPLNTLDEM